VAESHKWGDYSNNIDETKIPVPEHACILTKAADITD
jgi:hypothetical protein